MGRITKEIREIIGDKVYHYFMEGYSVDETVSMLDDELHKYYEGNVDRLYGTVNNAYNNLVHLIKPEEYAAVLNARKERRSATKSDYEAIAKRFRQLCELDYSLNRKPKAYMIIDRLEVEFGKSEHKIMNAIKTFEEELYKEIAAPKVYTEEELLYLADKIINEDMHSSSAKYIDGYEQMIKLLQEKYPEKYAKMKEGYASHKVNTKYLINRKALAPRYSDMLLKIMCEFRVPLNVMCEFINVHRDILLTNPNVLLTSETLEESLKNDYTSKQTIWYVYETSAPDEFTEFRINRFNHFAARFAKLKGDDESLRELVRLETNYRYGLIDKRVAEHHTGDKYNFTEEEARIILNYFYKNGLALYKDTRNMIGSAVRIESLEEKLRNSDNFDDIMLLKGIEKLREYNKNFTVDLSSGPKL